MLQRVAVFASVLVTVCVCVWEVEEDKEVEGTPLTLTLHAARTLHVGRGCGGRALRRRAGDGLTLNCSVLTERKTNYFKKRYYILHQTVLEKK